MDCWRALGTPLYARRMNRASVMCETEGCRRTAEFLFTLGGTATRGTLCAAYCSTHASAQKFPERPSATRIPVTACENDR
jgi:hypothetical protein